MKCGVCKENIEVTFLQKIMGTYITHNNKKHTVCSLCQKKLKTDEALREHL